MDKETQDKIVARELLRGDIVTAPCIFCGYTGVRYWQRYSHLSDCPWYEIGGASERGKIIQKIETIAELGYRKE